MLYKKGIIYFAYWTELIVLQSFQSIKALVIIISFNKKQKKYKRNRCLIAM